MDKNVTTYKAMVAIEPGVFKKDGAGYEQIANDERYLQDLTLIVQDCKAKVEKEFEVKGLESPTVKTASAIYLTDWGCPSGGEIGVELSGKVTSADRLLSAIHNLMADFGQSTVTVEYFKEDNIVGSAYLENTYMEGKPRSYETLTTTNDTKNDIGLHFKIDISNDRSFNDAGQALQEGLSKTEGAKCGVYPTGILTITENGYTYEGTQNTRFTPSKDAYDAAVYDLANTCGLTITNIEIQDAGGLERISRDEREHLVTEESVIEPEEEEEYER